MKHKILSFGRLTCFILAALGFVSTAYAATEIGLVMNVEGSFSAKGTNGALRPLAAKDKVYAGDTLFTGRDSYARVKFADGGQISLRPTSQFKIDSYHFNDQQPEKDAAEFNLLKGSLRAISGLIGKRGDPDSYSVKTREATAGIRGTKFGVRLCQGDCGDVPPPPDGGPIADGTHFDVLEGTIIVKNSAGSQLLNAGQFGFVSNISTPPIEIPPERAVRVEIPPKISLDNIRGAAPAPAQNQAVGAVVKPADAAKAAAVDAQPVAKNGGSTEGAATTTSEKNAESTESATGDAATGGDASTPNACPK